MSHEVNVGEVWEDTVTRKQWGILHIDRNECFVVQTDAVRHCILNTAMLANENAFRKVLEADGTPVSAHDSSKDVRMYAIDWDDHRPYIVVGSDAGVDAIYIDTMTIGIEKIGGRTLVGYKYPWSSCPQRDPCRFAFKKGRVAQVDRATHAVFERLAEQGSDA
jgi:hypothetical protein